MKRVGYGFTNGRIRYSPTKFVPGGYNSLDFSKNWKGAVSLSARYSGKSLWKSV